MNKFYVVCNTYYPNTAFSNRVFNFQTAFSTNLLMSSMDGSLHGV